MSITVGQIILDAQRVANGVKDLEARTNALLVEAEGNNRQIETMKQFRDDLDSLNKLTRDKSNADMVNRINQNPSIREIRQENRELKESLEDYQRALELIMHKYREHTQHQIFTSKINLKDIYNATLSDVIRKQKEKINEMAAVIQKAASIDDDVINKEIECMNKLKIENEGLRELLQISKQFGSSTNHNGIEEKYIQTDTDESNLMKNGEVKSDEQISDTSKNDDKQELGKLTVNGDDSIKEEKETS